MDRVLIAGIMGTILLSVFAAAFADASKISEEKVLIMRKNTEMNTIEINVDIDVNTIDANKEPRYQPVSEEHVMNAVESNKGDMESIKESENNVMKKAKNTEQKVVKMVKKTESKIIDAAKTEEKKGEHVEYKRSGMVAIPVPAIVEGMGEKKVDINGVKVGIACEDGVCIVKMPKSTAKTVKIQTMIAFLQNAVQAKVKVKTMSILDRNGFVVAKAVAVEGNRTKVMYATADQGTFAVIADIPKYVLPNAEGIEGNIVILKADPVLKIYLRSEKNRIGIAGYSIEGDVNVISKDRVVFAICAVRISDATIRESGDKYSLKFKVRDNMLPVYVPNVRVTLPGKTIIPQYDDDTKTYSALLDSANHVKIIANIDGCGEIVYYIPPPRDHEGSTVTVMAIAILAFTAVGWLLWKSKSE